MIIQNYKFDTDAEIRSVITDAENAFNTQIENVADVIDDNPDLRFVVLSGPTCSGKTTTAMRFINTFSHLGRNVTVISIDDFYRNNGGSRSTDCSRKIDYESADALDLAYFEECVDKISSGRQCLLPLFDFKCGMRSGYMPYYPHPTDIIMFEGIQGVYPEIISLLPLEKLSRLYITVDDDITVCGSVFRKREIRLIRRIVRDFNYRAANPDFTLFLWKHVIENEDKNIIPREADVPVHINSLLAYELNMIKRSFLECIKNVPESSEYRAALDKLAAKFNGLPEIGLEYLPEDSVFREFVKINKK